MGSRIKRPVDFQGITRKEARLQKNKEGDVVMKGKGLNQRWRQWNESSEQLLAQSDNNKGK
eukprot:2879425-Heterocapsa_arctica.AAC.1